MRNSLSSLPEGFIASYRSNQSKEVQKSLDRYLGVCSRNSEITGQVTDNEVVKSREESLVTKSLESTLNY